MQPPDMPMKAPKQRHGKDVYYANSGLHVEVIADDCLPEMAFNTTNCAMATACKRAVVGCVGAEIGRYSSFVEFADHIFKYRTSERLARQFTAFDQGGNFLPGVYELTPIPPKHREPRKRGTQRGTGKGNMPTVRFGPSHVRQLAP